MLEIHDIKKVFQRGTSSEQQALAGLSLRLQQGEFVTVIGSNGAGKSTLFGAIAGSFFVDQGSIRLDGEDITYQKEYLRAKHIGRLFQDPNTGTAPGLTIEENLALVYSKATRRFSLSLALRAADRRYFKDLLARLDMGLENRLKAKVGLLSGGQRQALTLLLSTMVPPKLLLLDEHTAALDPLTAAKVMELTEEIAGQNKITTLMITHNVASALKMGTRTIMMDKGQIVMDLEGEERRTMTSQDLLQRYRQIMHKELDNDRMLFSGEEE
ncbi:MAG: ATP-binding cassette domain-containing protein [Clostridiales bacterium]